ncbi:modular serine protease-like [Melitaea cinxia]|uniref:modular serine protease-like n=1 Tax=Melitaea cinxia TaxID=113334 RepID=UPI001E274464|nr:modular serine protease-like [Melitaea cinxia]
MYIIICYSDEFKCNDGTLLELYKRCDGIRDCKDGSDETLNACAGNICPSYLFQCAYGACVEEGVDCNDVFDCADGSDESEILCKRSTPPVTTSTNEPPTTTSTIAVQILNMCMLPPHPKNGRFLKNGDSDIYEPGELITTVYLNITCMPGYKVVGDEVVFCIGGLWYPVSLPSCVQACELPPSESVEYRCIIRDAKMEGTRECSSLEAEGTMVQPECRRPNYYSPITLSYMVCVDGRWSHTPICQPECGTLTPVAEPLIAGGSQARRGEVPWHVTVYSQLKGRFQQICGGSLISDEVFISAAHCFWMEGYGALPPELFAAVAGKLYRAWDDRRDLPYAQFLPIKEIILANRFAGAELLYQDDLAIIRVSGKFLFRPYVRPVCVDFLPKFNEFQLRPGNKGKVAGFGLTSDQRESESAELKVVELPYVDWEECMRVTPPEYSPFLIGNKFCAGYLNSTALCKGDSGGGLAFPSYAEATLRYTLRGVTSTGPLAANGASCNLHALTAFTALQPHQSLVRAHLH